MPCGAFGVRYTVCPVNKALEFEEKAGEGWVRWGTEGQLAVYENQNALPMAYAYDSYVTQEEFEAVGRTSGRTCCCGRWCWTRNRSPRMGAGWGTCPKRSAPR